MFPHKINAGPARGLYYPIHLPQDKQIWIGTYETEVARAICDAVIPGKACFDIGAHRGFLSGVMAVAGASEVHCFEPNPGNIKQLRSLRDLNKEYRFILHEMAVGNHSGTAEFLLMGQSSMGKVQESDFQSDVPDAGKLTVQAGRLDDLIDEGAIPPPGLIKIDVEGAEEFVLEGGAKLLRKHRPHIILEAHSQLLARRCTSALRDAGYRVESLHHNDDLEENPEATSHWVGKAA
jgi:FkbM family methyltransferase